MSKIIHGYCTLCRSRCGTLNEVDGDQLVAVRPDNAHPTGKAMCMKGRAAPEIVHSPHRVFYPMRRTNPKGAVDPGWVRISWGEALGEVAKRLGDIKAQHGAEAVVFSVTTPSGTPLSDSIDWIERFVRTFGSPNICYGTEVCNWHKDVAHAFTFGCGMPPADYANADTVMLWGHNPANTWLAQADAIARGRANGSKLLVVDPRPTALARQADVWLQVRPGTDTALALGIIRVMIDQKWYDEAFVRAWTNAPFLVRNDTGHFLRERSVWPDSQSDRYVVWDEQVGRPVPYDPVRQAMLEEANGWKLEGSVSVKVLDPQRRDSRVQCTPAFERLAQATASYDRRRVREITGVEPHLLKAAAELLQAGRRVAYHSWTGIGQHANATQNERAVACLYALSGSFDRVGGNRVRRGPFFRPVNSVDKIAPIRPKALGIKERPIGPPAMGWVTALDTYRAIIEGEPYKVRAMMAFGTNLAVSQADARTAEQALAALEFHVHCDLFETPAARYADIFLPINTPWEREGIRFGFEINDEAASLIQMRQRMVSPRGETRSDNDILFDLACRLGMKEEFFQGSLEAGWDYMLEPLGLSVSELRESPRGVKCEIDAREQKYALPHHEFPARIRGFDTETQRVELYSELLFRNGQPPVPQHSQPLDKVLTVKQELRKYPLILSTAKNGYYCHSQHRSLVSLRKRAPDPIIEISPDTAAEKGIHDGDWIQVKTYVGAARFVAKTTPRLANDVVVAEFGWWQACPELDRAELNIIGAASSNFNSLISAEIADPVSGATPMRSFRCNIELDPLTELRQRKWQGFRRFRVSTIRAEAEGVKSFFFEPEDGTALPDFRPGQHIEIRTEIDGATVSRAYSLTGPARLRDRTHYRISVRHQNGRSADGKSFEGLMSSYLHKRLMVGDLVELKAPSGNFVIPSNSQQPLIFLAGGIGITPFINALETFEDGNPIDATLYYGNLNSSSHAFKARIDEHRARLPNLKVINHYDRPLPSDRLGIDYDSTSFITADLLTDETILQRPRVFMCGPPPMMDAFARGLVGRGVPKFDIFREIFRSPPSLLAGDDGKRFAVTFAASGKAAAEWSPPHGSLLNFGEELKLSLPSGCRVGQCESCTVKIISGKVIHLHGQEPDDPSTCLLCQAVPIEDLVLDA